MIPGSSGVSTIAVQATIDANASADSNDAPTQRRVRRRRQCVRMNAHSTRMGHEG